MRSSVEWHHVGKNFDMYFVVFTDNGRLEIANKYFIDKADAQDYARSIARSREPMVVKVTEMETLKNGE